MILTRAWLLQATQNINEKMRIKWAGEVQDLNLELN